MRIRTLLLAAAAAAAGMLACLPAHAQRYDNDRAYERGDRGSRGGWWWQRPGRSGFWEKLGEQRVGFNVDRDVIRVGREEGRFDALQLRIRGNDIQLLSARIVLANGETEDLRISGTYRAGSETESVRFDHRSRRIDRVELTYRSNPRQSNQAIVELWGLHADDRREVVPPPAPIARGPAWEMLGDREVNFKRERDEIRVGRWEGTFNKIRLKVLKHDIELRDVTVVYGNGETDQWVIRRRVRDEEEGPVFNQSGRRRVVERILLTYRGTNPFGSAIVQVWGGR